MLFGVNKLQELIRNRRKFFGLTQKQLACQAGISRSAVSRMEAPHGRGNYRWGDLVKAGRVLNVTFRFEFVPKKKGERSSIEVKEAG
jgi:transcriptional regulator with XRE-family HTH domain